MKLGFITCQNPEEQSGGQSSISFSIYKELCKHFECERFYHPLPNEIWWEKLLSKTRRIIGLKGVLPCFSERRLQQICNTFCKFINRNDIDVYFFNSMTQWINIFPTKPYYVYNDICFSTYKDIYFDSSKYLPACLNNIMKKEAFWLSKASGVFLRSQWACNLTVHDYELSGENIYNVGRGVSSSIPSHDIWQGEKNLVFISREFFAKGGLECFEAYKMIHNYDSSFQLFIIGEAPPENILNYPGVSYCGWINKNSKEGKDKFSNILEKAMFLIHPTHKDTNPLVITEAGYWGCPSISVRAFAIPELIQDGITGFLISTPVDYNDIFKIVIKCLNNMDEYIKIRVNTREYNCNYHTWSRVAKQMAFIIEQDFFSHEH